MRKKTKLNRQFFIEAGRKGGLIGGKARAKSIGPERCREIAKLAAAARWKGK